ncbi:hypothetical protein SAMN04488504_10724 [Myxococcus virescens]|uniref:Uncharacterized protein n=1 Tax=Myxococcus virescens TaxID=83456 RepID=A0ABY0MSS3_9BACT|nr:hypothetical protein SAMN04488504_10724 [Myxococcus virescens]
MASGNKLRRFSDEPARRYQPGRHPTRQMDQALPAAALISS